MSHRISLDLKILLGIAVLTICIPVFSQNNPYYTRLRIVNSNNDTALSLIMMNTDQDTTLIVQGKRSDNGEWDYVMAKWEVLDSMLLGKLVPAPPGTTGKWTFGGLTYASGRLRVTLGKDSICEPDTIRIEIRPGCGPAEGTFTFLSPVDHVQSGDTVAAVVRVGSYGDFAGWPYCRLPACYCFPDSVSTIVNYPYRNLHYSDSLVSDIWPASIVITGEGSSRIGKWDSSGFQLKECFINGIDTARFVFYAPGLHTLFLNFFGSRIASSNSFVVYPRTTCPCGMALAIRPHSDTTIESPHDSLRLEAFIYDDTAGIRHEYDTLLAWSLVHNGTGGRLKAQSGSLNTFYSDSGTGLYRIAVTCTDVSKFPASWPLLNRSDTVNVTITGLQGVVKRLMTRSSSKPSCTVIEYYSLRGQKLPAYRNKHTDGIVLERTIESDGKSTIRKAIKKSTF